ncbi:MAG TPA: IS3 family transposase [Verrucomicrobiae bacterium]|nr:IS3 family transposase [Verrucomicrobiae bacterium]
MKFITDNWERWGVTPICRVRQVAPAPCYAASSRPPAAREIRDQELKPQIQRVWGGNFRVYRADKVWAQRRREGVPVARCTVERLMRDLGPRGAARGKAPRTTLAAAGVDRRADRVERHFVAGAPNRL